jgi:hypothetical protein
MPMPTEGFPGDATPEEIEEKLMWEFRQTGGTGGTVSAETAQALIKLMDDAGKGQPPDPEKEKERAEAKEKARAEAQKQGLEANKEAKQRAEEEAKAKEA